jgi:hypothetical protein
MLHVPPSVEYGQPYGFSCSRSVPINFKPLLGIVTRKDFYFIYFLASCVEVDNLRQKVKNFS